MVNFAVEQFSFFFSVALLFFVPGFLLLRAIFGPREKFTPLELFVFSFTVGLVAIDLAMLLLNRVSITLTRESLLLSAATLSFLAVAWWPIGHRQSVWSLFSINAPERLSRRQYALVAVLIVASVFIRTIYAKDTILPTTTDMGHHMYWAKRISESGKIPTYEKRDIVSDSGSYSIGEPQKIADFIVGEHLPFSAISLVSGVDYFSSFPALFLLLINILSVLAIFILSLRLFEKTGFGANVAILVLFFLGPLYALSPPQAKYALGGVIGNMIGNLLIPVALYFIYRALVEKKSSFLALSGCLIAGLFYTHHLSAFIFLFILASSIFIFAALNIKRLKSYFISWSKLFFHPSVLAVLAGILVFIFVIYTPSYIDTGAVKTVARAPSKPTREGLTFVNLALSTGEARMALGIAGAFLILLAKKRRTYWAAITLGWSIILFLMILKPGWLRIDIPSIRVASYISYPLAILSGFAIAFIADKLKGRQVFLEKHLHHFAYLGFAILLLVNGGYDNSQTLRDAPNYQNAVQTYESSKYVARYAGSDEMVVKDHNYLDADAWIKLFFMRDYNYPLTRGFFSRYEDTAEVREPCPLWMISTPNSADADRCFKGLQTNYVMVNPVNDSSQFIKSDNFWHIYSSEHISVFYRP